MSAFVVEDRTINRIISYLNDSRHSTERDIALGAAELSINDERWHEKLGMSMAMMNVDAVNQRYNEHDEPTYEWHWDWENSDAIQVYKSLNCWLYQCCEGDVPERPLYKAFREVERVIAAGIITNLPQYDAAQWG